MRITDTGNVYMTYPDAGRPMSDWDTGKAMNLDMISSPFIKWPGVVTEENKPFLEELVELSKQYKERMDACPFAEWDDFVTEVKKEIKANEIIYKDDIA
jgi:hypothetical protein